MVSSKPYSELSALKQKRSTIAVRKWYVYHDKIILEQIDVALPLEQKAQLACELRNQHRTQARQLMADVTERKRLDVNEPNRSFSELLAYKMTTKGLSRDDALRDILETSSKTRTSVNKNTDWRTMMFEYNICTVADKTLFYKQCEALVKNIPHLVPEPLLHDVDDSLIQIYNHPDGSISVRNDCQVDALYIQSDFDINPYFNKNQRPLWRAFFSSKNISAFDTEHLSGQVATTAPGAARVHGAEQQHKEVASQLPYGSSAVPVQCDALYQGQMF